MRVSALGSLAALAALAACSPMDKGQGLNQFDTKSFWCSGWACGGGSGDGGVCMCSVGGQSGCLLFAWDAHVCVVATPEGGRTACLGGVCGWVGGWVGVKVGR